MSENVFLRVKHSFNCGDALTILPGLKHVYETTGRKSIFMQRLGLVAHYYDGANHPVKNEDGEQVCMNLAMWEMLKPLLEAQVYIERCEVWEGQEFDIDFDVSRDRKSITMPNGSIHHWAFFIAPELACDLSKSWFFGIGYKPEMCNKIIVNRTERYQNPYFSYYFLKQYEERLMFAGTEYEHKSFCEKWGLSMQRIEVDNFLELAEYIMSCKLFIGNQSMCWHIADGLKAKRVLEYCPQFPNTHPTGGNGYAALYQQAMELYVSKLS